METTNTPRMSALFRQLAAVEQQLWEHFGVKDQGQYAAQLVAQALGARKLANGVNKGYDLHHDLYGRIEVRSRRYPLDGRREDRAQVPVVKAGHFDHFVHLVFDQTFSVVGAYVCPHDRICELAAASKNRCIRYAEGVVLPGVIDITGAVRQAQAAT